MQSQHSVHGIVLIDKPSGITSNQALGRIKRIFGIKKSGHTGTLDPMASGLLVVCLGHATRVAGHLINSDKAYQARIHLGVTTDTEDAEGTVMEQHPVPMLERSQVLDVLSGFVGEIQQVPPMYSALKHQGRRLYDLARKGQEVDRPARSIRIDELQLIEWHLDDQVAPGFSIEVRCSKGTYIRSLARDIGEALGCGAHLSFLRRTYADPFDLDEAITPDDLESRMSTCDLLSQPCLVGPRCISMMMTASDFAMDEPLFSLRILPKDRCWPSWMSSGWWLCIKIDALALDN